MVLILVTVLANHNNLKRTNNQLSAASKENGTQKQWTYNFKRLN